jgi:putative glutamine amidotransferase
MATTLNAPVILISGGSASSASVQAAATMVAAQGAVPMIVSNHLGRVKGKDRDGLYEEATRLMQKADGILVMGNNADIDPSEYGQDKNPRTNSELTNKDGSVNEEGMARRNLETVMMKIALGAGMPMFGICGGMQRINVICGGDLHQHIPDAMRDAQHSEHAQQEFGIPPFVAVQPVDIKKDTLLGSIADSMSVVYTPARTKEGDIHLDVNSMHHQAVGRIGEGLRIAAESEDVLKDGKRLVEAIEIDPNGPLATGPLGNPRFGVFTQWHPEFSDSPLGAKIATNFVAHSQAFAMATDRRHTLEEVQEEKRISALPVVKQPAPEATARANSMVDMIMRRRAARQQATGLTVQ